MRTTESRLTAFNRSVEGVHDPIGDVSPGAAWLKATAARAAEVQRLLAEGHNRDTLQKLTIPEPIGARRVAKRAPTPGGLSPAQIVAARLQGGRRPR
jgi:hypothetical protein